MTTESINFYNNLKIVKNEENVKSKKSKVNWNY